MEDTSRSNSAHCSHDAHHCPPIRRSPFFHSLSVTILGLGCVLLLPLAQCDPLESTSRVLEHSEQRIKLSLPAGAVEHQQDVSAALSMAAKLHAAHAKTLAMKHLGVKAENFQTQGEAEEDKSNKQTANVLPFLLPPIGLLVLTTIGCAVVGIRRWQKIPSMPTQGRMDIADVKASAARAGGIRTPPGAKEMKPQWG